MKWWTDYPIAELGDQPKGLAPVRECEVLAYDGNKYVRIEVRGKKVEVKAGYVYPLRTRTPFKYSLQNLMHTKAQGRGSEQMALCAVCGTYYHEEYAGVCPVKLLEFMLDSRTWQVGSISFPIG